VTTSLPRAWPDFDHDISGFEFGLDLIFDGLRQLRGSGT